MTARFLFTLAVQMQAVVIGWRMYELTHDPLYLGFIGLAEAIPALSLALFAGYLVDRSRPLFVYRTVIFGSLLSGLVLLASQIASTHFTPPQQVWLLFISSILTGSVRAFAQPAIFASVPRIVPRHELPQASAWMSSAMQVARISGPGVGGLIFGFFGMVVSAAVVCSSLLLAIGCMFSIRVQLTALAAPVVKSPLRDELLSGASFVFRHPILLSALSLDMISVLFGGVTALLPIYASDILMVGPKGLGWLRAAPAVGAAITSLWLTRKTISHGAGRLLLTAVAGFGLSILVFALSQNYILSLLALGFSGAFDSVSMVIRSAAVQLASPDSMRGRISAVNSIFIGSSNELGEFESGIAAKLLGTVPAAVFGSVICLSTVAVVALISPALRRLDLQKLAAAHGDS